MTASPPPAILSLASYYKGGRFLERVKEHGGPNYLLTVESLLTDPWPRHALDDVFAVPTFADRKTVVKAVAYLMRTRKIDRIVALDDFDVELAGFLREHFRLTDQGHGESAARLFRDKLAMRVAARDLGIRIPEFTGIFHHDDVRHFLATVPGPWLVKPRGEASAAGIRKCPTADDVWQRIDGLGDEQSFHLVERMVPGDLYHVDSLVRNGQVIFAEVNQYRKPLLDVYQGGGIYATRTMPRDRPEVAKLRAANAAVLEGFGLGHGASHTEFMRAHADGQFYFIETSCRVGGAETATMVEHATGINLWAEWASLEVARTLPRYELPAMKTSYGGVVISLARQEKPDTSAYTDPEIVYRVSLKNHVGFVLCSDDPARIDTLLDSYTQRIATDFLAVLPGADKVSY